jgi:hypothetical protein
MHLSEQMILNEWDVFTEHIAAEQEVQLAPTDLCTSPHTHAEQMQGTEMSLYDDAQRRHSIEASARYNPHHILISYIYTHGLLTW